MAVFTYDLDAGHWLSPRPVIGTVSVGDTAQFKGSGGKVRIEFAVDSPFSKHSPAEPFIYVGSSLSLRAERVDKKLTFTCGMEMPNGTLAPKKGGDFPVDK
jgi:hypothetical protein